MSKCHCGKDGHALNSINCPVHGIGRWRHNVRVQVLDLIHAWNKRNQKLHLGNELDLAELIADKIEPFTNAGAANE